MWKRIRNIFKVNSQTEESPSVMIQRAIYEMRLSVEDSNVAIKNAQVSQYEIQKKLDAYKGDASRLQKEATDLAKKKKAQEAKQILAQKELVDKQVAQYEALNNNILQTIAHLQFQQQQMKLKIDELQTKEVLLSAKLTNAKTQAEIAQQLSELNQVTNFHFEQLEQDAQQMENMTIVLNSLQAGATEAEVDRILGQEQISKVAQLNSSFENLLSDIDKEEKERQRLIDEAKNKKVDLLFSQMKGGNMSAASADTQNGYSDNGKNTPSKEEKIKIDPDEFFKSTDLLRDNTQQKELLNSFFSQTPEKEEPLKDDKQKLLDDFFN
jgi:phage shock protein A